MASPFPLGKIRMTPPNLVAAISTAPISSLIEASESLVVATLDITARPLVNFARTEPDSMESPSSGRPSWSRDSRTANFATSALARPCKQNRTEINGKAIFPEPADREIMAICRNLAAQSLEGLGSILVATRDGDFTLTARAFEERFGYGIIKNSKMLNSWLN